MSKLFFDYETETFHTAEIKADGIYETQLSLSEVENRYYEQRMLGITTDQAIKNLNLIKIV